MQRETLLKLIRTGFNLLSNFRVEGAEYIPASGPIILTTNHISRLDYPALLMCSDRKDVIAMVATKYREKVFFRWIIETLGFWRLSRSNRIPQSRLDCRNLARGDAFDDGRVAGW